MYGRGEVRENRNTYRERGAPVLEYQPLLERQHFIEVNDNTIDSEGPKTAVHGKIHVVSTG